MATATKRPDTDCKHRKFIKCKKIEEKKKLQEENDKIDRILRSPEYTEADKERHFQQRGRNLKEILKLSKEINEIDNGLLSPGGSCPVKRLRDIEDNEIERQHLREENDEDLNRLRQLEIIYKSEAEVLRSNQTDLENKVQHLQAEKERLQLNGETERKEAEELRHVLYAEKRNSNELRERIKDLERLLNSKKGREQLKQDSDKELYRLRQLENNYKIEQETLKSNHTDLEKKVKQLQDERERLLQIEKSERKIADEFKRELVAEKRDSKKLRERMKDLEKESLLAIEKIETGRKQVLDGKDRELIRLKQSEINYKSEAEVLRSNQTDLENKVHHLQAEKERLQLNGETERKAAEELRHVLYAEKRNSNELRDRIKDLERFKEQEIYYKSETEVLKSIHTDLEKKVQHLQAETKRLQRNGEMERKIAEELRCELDSEKGKSDQLRDRIKDLERLLRIEEKGREQLKQDNDKKLNRLLRFEEKGREQLKQDNDKNLNRLRRLESVYKNETDTLKHELADLRKTIELLQEEKHMITFPKVDPSLSEENSRLKEDLKHLGRELQKAQQKATSVDEKDGSDSLTLTLSEAVKEFQGIFEKEWKEAAQALSNVYDAESHIWQKLYEILKICLCETNTECTDITESLKRFRYFKSDHNPQKETIMKIAGVATAVPTKTKKILQMISTGNHQVPSSVPNAVKIYIQRCTEIALLLRMLYPQLAIVSEIEVKHMDPQKFEIYSGEGNFIDFVVWPYILENDIVIVKGQVNACTTIENHFASKDDHKEAEHYKCSDIEGSVIRYVENQDTESGNPSASVGTSPIGMACSVTNYDLTSDFLKSCSIKAQKE